MSGHEGLMGGVGAFSGSFRSLSSRFQPALHVRRHGLQRLSVRYHRLPLQPRHVAKRTRSYEEQEGEEREQASANSRERLGERAVILAIASLGFIPALRIFIKLIDDGHTRLGFYFIGVYLLLLGGTILVFYFTIFSWSWERWL
jgi:hypothetical protein